MKIIFAKVFYASSKITLVTLVVGLLTASIFTATPAREIITPENIEKWEAGVEGSSRGAIQFDKDKRQIHINTFETKGHGQLFDVNHQYVDFRIDCVVNFSKVYDHYSGLSLYLRDDNGKRYWVYWRPQSRGIYALKVRSDSTTIEEYEKGKKQADRPDDIELNQDYTFSVEIRGRRIRAFLDGTPMLEFVDPQPGMYLRGRIGFSGLSCDVTLKSVKITDLDECEKLPVRSYTYTNPPEKGDRSGKILTDDKINGREEQASWQRTTKGDPVITFDLGKECLVNGIKLKALAVPNANISAYRIQGSPDGEKWQVLAGEANDSSDSREQEQVLETKLSGMARYVKVLLFHHANRSTIKLDEVEIMGGAVKLEEKAAAVVSREEFKGAKIPSWKFPYESETVWYLGNGEAAWGISKTTGQVVGGWNAKIKECYLLSLEGRYHLEDRKSLVTGVESQDTVQSSKFFDKEQRLELTCANSKVPDLTIRKRYWVRGNKLFQRVGFVTKSNDLQFITYNSNAKFEQAYRDAGYYMGGGDGGGPLVPAPRITAWQKVTEHQNTAKGMVLHQPENGYGFAHIRTRLDDQFVWPWFTGAIASYCEKENVLQYTPDGWDMSLGTSRLSQTKETSYEQYVSVFEGDWQKFFRSEYALLPEVQQGLKEIPPVPGWVGEIKADTSSDIQRVRRLLEVTDEGYIMVLVDLGGSWADYYVDRGLEGGWAGGSITAEELKDLIQRIKALSPRVKVGTYMWNLSTFENCRIYKKHPEWFRTANKDGEQVSTFPGVATNYAYLLSIPECYNELLAQVDLVLGYLGTDFIFLDSSCAVNLIDWKSGEYSRDDLCFRLYRDMKRVAAKHGLDKMVFFNNRGNPYGDINYIEARATISADYWRQFTGIAAVMQEFVSSTRPKARIVPLYYVTPHERDYVNRVLAMGWIPELVYGNVLERRAFIQAAYEIGNCTTVPVRYSPDWKRDKVTKIESYAVQRGGDPGYLLSFISHEEKPQTLPVELDLDSFKLDRNGPVFVWEYVVENANEYKGVATERLARSVYRNTGWQLDRVTRRRLVYAGPYREKLELGVNMKPLLLYQLYVTSQPEAVYSENHLPANYLFGRMPKVSLREKADWKKGSVKIQVDSSREEVEIVVFLPLSSHRLGRVSLDGQPVEPVLVWEGGDVFPVIKVGQGRHTVAMAFSSTAVTEPVVVKGLSADESPSGLRVGLPGFDKAILTIEKDGRVLSNRMAKRADRDMVLPLASARNAGEYLVSLRAVVDGKGQVQLATSDPAVVRLPAAVPDLGLSSEKSPMLPGKREIVAVNREIQGLNVLRSAVLTTETPRGSFQPNLEALMVSVNPDDLLLEAGTTRKIQDDSRGAAFAGLEIKNLRKIKVKLSNTFHNAFHIRGKGYHVPLTPNSRNFAGIIVDYHTAKDYTKRVRFAVGVMHPECSSTYPDYGKVAVADEAYDLGMSLIEVPEKTFALDLQRYAPKDWDGQVWLSVGSDWVASDRRLKLQILAANEAVSGEFLSGTDPKAYQAAYRKPKTLMAPRSPGGIVIDGSSDEEMWRGGARAEQFFLNGGEGVSKARTTAMLLYDDENLYVTFICMEPNRRKPFVQGGAIWDDDEVEIWIDAKGDGKTYRQVIVNGVNEKMEFSEGGPNRIGAKTAVRVVEGESWMVEMAIPFAGLGVKPPKPGDTWRLSLCRYRPAGKDFNSEQIVWAPLQGAGFKDLANFGTLTFK